MYMLCAQCMLLRRTLLTIVSSQCINDRDIGGGGGVTTEETEGGRPQREIGVGANTTRDRGRG